MIVAGIDIETTGLLKPEHRIIELCIQKWHYHPSHDHKHALIDTKTWRFNPERSIDAKAYEAHKIALDDLAGEPRWDDALPYILEHMKDVDLFIAHNGDEFDRPFIRMECSRVGKGVAQIDEQKWFDTMLEGRWADPWGKVPTLKQLCWASDVRYDDALAHAADYDVGVMMKSFFFGVRRGVFSVA